jgi:Flp pilus assembly protein TadG
MRTQFSTHNTRGQSLVETALILPLLIMLVLNVVNLGYFFLVVINLTGTARTATLYSIEGSSTPAASALPGSGGASPTTNLLSVTYLAFQDMTGALWNPTGASVQVCSPINTNGSGSGVNGSGTSQNANCETCTSSGCGSVGTGTPTPSTDPEAPSFVLNQVDIAYSFSPLIPGQIFNIPLQAFSGICNSGTCAFTRTARMRAMN